MRSRPTTKLSQRQVGGLYNASWFATLIGLQLNQFVTIYWSQTTPAARDVPARFIQLKERMHKWLRRRHCPLALIYVHECGQCTKHDTPDVPHTHLMVHLPPGCQDAFAEKLIGWVGGVDTEAAIEIKPVSDRRGLLEYFCKGTDNATAKAHGITRRLESQGVIHFKRAGWSQAIGEAAQARHDASIAKPAARQLGRAA